MMDIGLGRGWYRFSIESRRLTTVSGLWAVIWLMNSILSGCVTSPVPSPQAPPTPACPSCDQQTRETARLRQDLANRETELRDLRASQRDQVKVLQESTREVTRAKVKLRRLATQADAASYIAEVEVAMESLRSSLGAESTVPLMALSQAILDSTAAPFAQGDYGVAMDRAAQAEQLIALARYQARPQSRLRAPGEVPLQMPIPLKVTSDSKLRRQPLRKARVVGVLKKGSPLVALAYKGRWMRVEGDDRRAGWVDQMQLGAQ